MEVLRTPQEAREFSRQHRRAGRTVSLVPTMGSLHRGHAALIATAAACTDVVIVSVYVNPRQFNVASDFEAYPRNLEADRSLAVAAGAHTVYAPLDPVMYPDGFDTTVSLRRIAAPLEGAGRPGHFDGVATVVTKLLNACEPDVAVFGEKDFQQLAVVRRLVADIDHGTSIVSVPTVREEDGLALSSRNVRLTPAHRAAAPVIHAGLQAAVTVLRANGQAEAARQAFHGVVRDESEARVEYVSVADPHTLDEIEGPSDSAVVSCAVWFGEVRLIDNLIHGGPGRS